MIEYDVSSLLVIPLQQVRLHLLLSYSDIVDVARSPRLSHFTKEIFQFGIVPINWVQRRLVSVHILDVSYFLYFFLFYLLFDSGVRLQLSQACRLQTVGVGPDRESLALGALQPLIELVKDFLALLIVLRSGLLLFTSLLKSLVYKPDPLRLRRALLILGLDEVSHRHVQAREGVLSFVARLLALTDQGPVPLGV